MRKLVAATFLAAVALAAQSAAACDWNREANTAQQQVASTSTPVQQPQTATITPQTANTAPESSKAVEPTAPMVLVNDRH